MIDLVTKHIEDINELCKQYKVSDLELFGSAFSEKNFDPINSDIDFLVQFLPMDPAEHATAYFELLEKLQDMFSCNIDLLEQKAVTNPYLRESINKGKCRIYAA
ncbi:nucleotidyltransferase family protein [Planctomycetota bacterium]